jgi:hypothetical protein
VSNTSTGSSNFSLAYTVGGVAQTPVVLTGLPGGHTQVVHLPVTLAVPGTLPVVVNATVYPTGDPGCTAQDDVSFTVSGQVLAISMSEDDVTYCANQGLEMPMSVVNTGSAQATITFGFTFDGVTHEPVVFEGIPPGQSATMTMEIPPGDPVVKPLTCTVTAQITGSETCTLVQEGTVLVIAEECATTDVTPRVIDRVALSAYPNPVDRGAMTLAYAVPQQHAGRHVELTIYDVSGRVVRHVFAGTRESGEYAASWDLRSDDGALVSAGVYFSHLRVGPDKKTQRLLVIR